MFYGGCACWFKNRYNISSKMYYQRNGESMKLFSFKSHGQLVVDWVGRHWKKSISSAVRIRLEVVQTAKCTKAFLNTIEVLYILESQMQNSTIKMLDEC